MAIANLFGFVLLHLSATAVRAEQLYHVEPAEVWQTALEAALLAHPQFDENDLVIFGNQDGFSISCRTDGPVIASEFHVGQLAPCRAFVRLLIKDTIEYANYRDASGSCGKAAKYYGIKVFVYEDGTADVLKPNFGCGGPNQSAPCGTDPGAEITDEKFDEWCTPSNRYPG